ncbi:hypothetical protein RND71_011812 [Anisodus tanguticus]|uniref:Cupin type-1 domain-containing protein n=1 Tax=Anisodus tanguticus TaxID=243964 RepID=A0AAE1VQ61_9SOLA|nr:hypothetical protein RND71_011812 [Anisodus tanguticus]
MLVRGRLIDEFIKALSEKSIQWANLYDPSARRRNGSRVVCPSTGTKQQACKNMRFKVEEGDVFAVPRFHPMAQMAFNNNSFVFVGFSTTTKEHHPQGKLLSSERWIDKSWKYLSM